MGVLQRFGISYFVVASIHVLLYIQPRDVLPSVRSFSIQVASSQVSVRFIGKIEASSVRYLFIGAPMVHHLMSRCHACGYNILFNRSRLSEVCQSIISIAVI